MSNFYSQRLIELVNLAGLVPDTIRVSGTKAEIVLPANASTADKAKATQIVANFDWSDAAEDLWVANKDKTDAKSQYSESTKEARLLRAMMMTIVQIMKPIHLKLNEVLNNAKIKTAIGNPIIAILPAFPTSQEIVNALKVNLDIDA